MIGYITKIDKVKGYGFIRTKGYGDYYLHVTKMAKDENFEDLELRDQLEFDPGEDDGGNYPPAMNVSLFKKSEGTYPGIYRDARPLIEDLIPDEQVIMEKLGRTFFVTFVGKELKKGNSVYHYAYVRPTEYFRNTFRLDREITVVLSNYDHFEPRVLDVPGVIYARHEDVRLDRGCTILISRDSDIEEKLGTYLRDSNASQVVVPFSYDEFLDGSDMEETIRARFRKYLFDADLFADSSAITNDLFFFGRSSYVHDITTKCMTGTHCGIFGLRRSGKTSMLYAVARRLHHDGYMYAMIPCQSDLATLNWKNALRKVVQDVCMGVDRKDLYDQIDVKAYEEHASDRFEEDMNECLEDMNGPVTIMFDEIEAITFGINHGEFSDNLWLDGNNYVHFWNVIKGYYSKYPDKISILIAGTNPAINEMPLAGNGESNPMFQQLSQSSQGAFLPSFTVEETDKMVNTLGGYMGIKFNKDCVYQMTNSCGGHPYLIKLLCSCIHQYVQKNHMERPLEIERPVYDAAAKEFEKSNGANSFFSMILNILATNYPKEYESLKHLALYDDNVVYELKDNDSLSHLIGYGLVECSHDHYSIRYDMIRDYLTDHYKYEREGLSVEEQGDEIERRVSRAENSLRKLIRQVLLFSHGREEARDIVLDEIRVNSDDKAYDKALTLNYKQLFDPSKNTIYLTLLMNIILDNYEDFRNLPGFEDESVIKNNMKVLNYTRRVPAHAFDDESENWCTDDFRRFRKSMKWMEDSLNAIE